MIWRWGGRTAKGPDATPLYEALVRATRQPAFYATAQVPDTFEGRFELLILHAVLVLRRLAMLPDGAVRAQALTDTMFAQLDQTMRELGVSDLGVPKRMKQLVEAYRGRSAAYEAAFDANDSDAMAAALARNCLGRPEANAACGLASYAFAAARGLEAVPLDAFWAGSPLFPEPQPLLLQGDP